MKQLFSLLLFLISNLVQSQDLKPLELVQLVFTNETFVNEIPKHSKGEYNGSPNVTDISLGTNLVFNLLGENENRAVINMTLTDSLGQGFDTYVHLVKENVWKIEAFRALALTGIIEQLKSEFESMTDAQIDSLVSEESEYFNSKEDFYRELERIKMILELDDVIVDHFNANKEAFDTIMREIQALELNRDVKNIQTVSISDSIQADYGELLISIISTSSHCEDCYEFIIGGMIDNTVGYLYIPGNTDVPEMNPKRLIMLREIGNGWYLFKTT